MPPRAMPPTAIETTNEANGSDKNGDVASQTSTRVTKRQSVQRPYTRPELGSLYDIMYDYSGTSLYVLPICWTDLHYELLGVDFVERPVIDTPVPDLVPDRWLEPSSFARAITSELHILVRPDKSPRTFCKNRSIKHVLAKLFPETLSRAKTDAELDLFFGQRVYKKAIRVPCVWRTASCTEKSFDSATTIPYTSFGKVPSSFQDANNPGNAPFLAYINRSQLAGIRKSLFRVVRGPDRGPNEPVASLQRLRSKMLIPANIDHDPYIAAILLGMAQAHFYRRPPKAAKSSQESSDSPAGQKPVRMPPPKFRNVKVQVITHDDANTIDPNFIIYTATVTSTFLNRFLHPDKAPVPRDSDKAGEGLRITYHRVPFWPVLGLKERLSKALGERIAGYPKYGDPDHIALWEELLEPPRQAYYPPPAPSLKRSFYDPFVTCDSSFDGDEADSSDEQSIMSPDAKRRRTTQSISTLEVC
ncbi:hypothetical protein B0T26DRAFT_741581 [Lasiosphaeria miniovina]|uniref:Uncharacterized protein n=1 Tax=Lasiosphaeria miniovina TaxID=1954250 RepID=A0AA40AAQ7_9PEZI|nr:uncharacterized protein B0T26DRAFT_741581 [Lasiosphaeria miniovina]KAK0712440.1 hypothetical protein B0T26DRAFT_741581 [Lasiosphaeria miniovina]